jgi:hypothetical protein
MATIGVIDMRFSERMGKKEVKGPMQMESMDDDLRTALWNVVFRHALGETDLPHADGDGGPAVCLLKEIWSDVLTRPIDEIPASSHETVQKIKTWFFKAQWYDVYDLVEFIARVGANVYNTYGVASFEMGANGYRPLGGPVDTDGFKQECNAALEREASGYRFVESEIAPITDQVEVAAIEKALDEAGKHGLTGAREHIRSALEKLSDKKNPDYRNSIKESISAVESICKVVAHDPAATLGKALDKIQNGIGLHPCLKKGFSAIYDYTSDANGIRHAMTDQSTCDFDEAKYMLVSCSAFVNYLIGKANKTGLLK